MLRHDTPTGLFWGIENPDPERENAPGASGAGGVGCYGIHDQDIR